LRREKKVRVMRGFGCVDGFEEGGLMRFLIALVIGVAIGYVAFSPDMDTTRKELWAKVNAMMDGSGNNSAKK
jgi:hypothetical protein